MAAFFSCDCSGLSTRVVLVGKGETEASFPERSAHGKDPTAARKVLTKFCTKCTNGIVTNESGYVCDTTGYFVRQSPVRILSVQSSPTV